MAFKVRTGSLAPGHGGSALRPCFLLKNLIKFLYFRKKQGRKAATHLVLFFLRNSSIWAVFGRPCAKGRQPYPSGFLLGGIWAARGGIWTPRGSQSSLELHVGILVRPQWPLDTHLENILTRILWGVRGGRYTLTHKQTYTHRFLHKYIHTHT